MVDPGQSSLGYKVWNNTTTGLGVAAPAGYNRLCTPTLMLEEGFIMQR
jgi:hypothetical protein